MKVIILLYSGIERITTTTKHVLMAYLYVDRFLLSRWYIYICYMWVIYNLVSLLVSCHCTIVAIVVAFFSLAYFQLKKRF